MKKRVKCVICGFVIAGLAALCAGCGANGGSAAFQQPGSVEFSGAEREVYSRDSGPDRPPWFR